MTFNFLSVFTLLVSIPVIGEALAIFTGTRIMGKGKSWLSIKNDLLLLSDIAAGTAMLCMALIEANLYRSVPFYIFVVLSLITHAYRQWEYLEDKSNAYCNTRPLVVVNNIKLIGLAIILLYGLVIM